MDSNESENSRLSFDRFTRDSRVVPLDERAPPVGSFQLRKFEVETSVGGTCWSAARLLLRRLPFIAIRLLGHLDHVIHVASVGGRHFARARESTSFDINIGDTRQVYSGFPRYFPEPGTLLHLDVVTIAISTHGIVHCRSSLDRSSSSSSFSTFLSLSLPSVSSFNRTRSPRHSSTFCLAVQALPRPCHRENSSVISHGPTRTPA